MLDETRGSPRLRSWPRPRPGRRHPTNEFWSSWLKMATWLYRYQPSAVQASLLEATRGTPWMPRDIFISCMRGRAFVLRDENGWSYYPMALVNDVSESIDALAQVPGSMLFRDSGLWVPVPGGSAGEVLTYVDDDTPPVWAAGSSGSGQHLPLWSGSGSGLSFVINNTAYTQKNTFTFATSLDENPWTHFRMHARGQSNQAGVNVYAQLAPDGSPTTSIAASSDILTISSTYGWHSSAWTARTDGASGLQYYAYVWRGANSTVDVVLDNISVELASL